MPSGPATVARISDDPVHSSVHGDTVPVVLAVGVRSMGRGQVFHDEASLGACVPVWVRAGDGDGDRGEVATGPVACPAGTEVITDSGGTADRLTTDLEAQWNDVSEPEPHFGPCISGEVCDHGGG